MNNILIPIILLFCLILLAGCPDPDPDPEPFSVTSSSFTSGGEIAEKYCYDQNGHGTGDNFSPQLSWTGAPEDTVSFVLIMDDSSAAYWSHWILYYIPPNITTLPEGLGNNTVDCKEGTIGGPDIGYRGPYPPVLSGTHNYYFRVYALDISLDYMVASVANRAAVLTAMSGHILAEDSIMGTHSAH